VSAIAFQRDCLLNFAFDKLNMLAYDRVVLVHAQFFRLGAGILFGDIKEASASGGVQADFDGGWFSHDKSPACAVWVKREPRLKLDRL
jgi:hypothetical protein